jgi:cell division protein FtsL
MKNDSRRSGALPRDGRRPEAEVSEVRRSIDRRGLATFAAATLACVLVAAAALLHLWVRTRVTERGYQLSRLSSEYRDLTREHESLQIKAADLKSAQRIEELARSQLGMGPAALDRVVVLATARSLASRARLLALVR